MPGHEGGKDNEKDARARLRTSHADRNQAIDRLKAAFVHGRLTKDELVARTAKAYSARTYADLAALTADLPAAPAGAETPAPPVPRPQSPPPSPSRRSPGGPCPPASRWARAYSS